MPVSDERLARIRLLVGEAGLARLRAACVTVVGLGAVGSYATEALARAGVGRLRLVDFDVVHPSNLNRQLFALHSTLGRPKAEVAAERVRDIAPDCAVEPLRVFVHHDTLDQVLAGPPDVVIDAIDSYGPKVELLAAARGRAIPIVASMGAALRTDPTQVTVGPLATLTGCPLGRRVRQRLRQRGVPLDILCVSSREPVPRDRLGAPDAADLADLSRGRPRRALGSLPTLTGIFGLTAANEALRLVLGEAWPGPVGT
jgi:tRNA A37 threonylcarbamoyladenosine dehydratase